MTGARVGGDDAGPGVIVRPAGAEDVAVVAAVFLACWRTSYRDALPERVIALYDDVGAQALWRRSLARASATGGAVLVAERSDQGIVGVMRIGRDPDRPSAGHVFSLYVDPSAQGLGVGRRLLGAADEAFAAEGLTDATLWVFEANVEARRFYHRLGWQSDGAVREEPEYGEPELHLVRSIPVRAADPPTAMSDGAGPGAGRPGSFCP